MGWDDVIKAQKAKEHSAWNYAIQSLNAVKEAEALTAKLIADGFTQTGPDEFVKHHKEELVPQFEMRGVVNHYVDTGHIEYVNEERFQDTPSPMCEPLLETFIGYQDKANYVLLAGPYSSHGVAAFSFLKVWKMFEADKSLEMVFPLDKRNQELLTTFSIPATQKRKGAYGKV